MMTIQGYKYPIYEANFRRETFNALIDSLHQNPLNSASSNFCLPSVINTNMHQYRMIDAKIINENINLIMQSLPAA